MSTDYSRHHRGLFWPALLILVGIVALLVNTGALSADRLYALFTLWPLILVVIGLDIVIRHTLRGIAADVAALLVVLIAVGGAVAYVAASPNLPGYGTNQTLDAHDTVGDISHASLQIDVGGATISITSGDAAGGDLYEAHIVYTGPTPSVSLDRSRGALTISQNVNGFDIFRSYHVQLDLKLNPNVAWSINENSGAATDTFDLAGLRLTSMTVNTGASREDVTLGPPAGRVSITVNGGALTARIHRPPQVEGSVSVSGGAVSLDADGRQQQGVGDLSYRSAGFAAASDAYVVTVDGGACTVVFDTVAG